MFGPPKKVPLKGFFSDGIWHCNCNPRLPASHFQVKKEGSNTGRWFYTCQKSKETGCGFFLWVEEAKPREMRAVIGGSRSEGEDTMEAGKEREGNNWFKNLGKRNNEDEFGGWPLSPSDEKIAVEGIEQQVGVPGAYPETPKKAARTNMFTTPGSKRKRGDGMLPTPITGNTVGNKSINLGAYGNSDDDDVFSTPSTVPTPTNSSFGIRSPSNTPTPSRFLPTTIIDSSNTTHQNYDITTEVFNLLSHENLSESATTNLKELLNKHALRISGIAKGRDITRIALKAKDKKITELEMKIGRLEGEREMDRTVIRHFKSDMAESVAKRGGKGRGRGKS